MKKLVLAIAAFFGWVHAATAQETKPIQKAKTTKDTVKPPSKEKGGVKKMDTAATIQKATKPHVKKKQQKDTVTVKGKKV